MPSSRSFATALPIAVIFAAVFLTGAAKQSYAADAADPVVATVNGEALHRSDLEAAKADIQQLPPNTPLEQIYPQLLDQQIKTLLVTQAAKADKMEDDPEVQHRLARLKDEMMDDVYLSRIAKKNLTDDALHARYSQLIAKAGAGQEEVHARHILVPTEAEAKAIIVQLNKGANFAKLATEKSTDKNAKGGDLGYFTKDMMVPAFSDAAFKLKKGEYTKTPVKSSFGWHVILLEDRRTKAPPSFDEVKDQVRQQLERDAVDAKVAELQKNAKIEQFNLDGTPVKK